MLIIHKITFLLLFICITLSTGCRGEPVKEIGEVSTEVRGIVTQYFDAEKNGDLAAMKLLLTGEALAEVQINANRQQIQKEYLNIQLKEKIEAPNLAQVYADITAKYSEPSFHDRYAVNFYLIKDSGRWLIYRVERTAFERPELSPGEIPLSTEKVLKDYFSMPYELKKYNELQYLAGQALSISPTVQMNTCRQNPPDAISEGFELQDIESLGCSGEYCIAKVTYCGGNNDVTITAVVDLVDAGGQWKIARVDIVSQERGDKS